MDNNKLSTLLGCVKLPMLVPIICENTGKSVSEALSMLYKSEVYALLENADTWVWHYGALTLFEMLMSEVKTGKIAFPEGM